MRREQIRSLLADGQIMKKIIRMLFAIIVIFVIAVVLLMKYYTKNKKIYVTYNETANADYIVYLKENEFFDENYLKSQNQYISTLIDYIEADFDYQLGINENNVDYKYSYKIDANVDVREKGNSNSIYNFTDDIVPEKELTDNTSSNVTINKKVDIDYNHYNNIVTKFISAYQLKDVEATLTVSMHISVTGSSEIFAHDSDNDSVIQICIPLNTNTVDIDVSSDFTDAKANVILCKMLGDDCKMLLVIGLILIALDLILIIRLVRFNIRSMTAKSVYERKLRKILNSYGSYIQKVNNKLDMTKCETLELATFYELLEIREILHVPVLMVEDIENNETNFIIVDKTNVRYIYRLKVSDMTKRRKSK